MNIKDHIKDNSLKIIAKPNSPKTKINIWDKEKQALRIEVHAQPEQGKANLEIIKFFNKLTKKQTKIIKGLKSKEKLLKFI